MSNNNNNNNFSSSSNRTRSDKDKDDDRDKKGLFNFPDAEAKLAKLAAKSAFDKQKAEAHAKRQREAAETAAVYQDFIKSFDVDENPPSYAPHRHNVFDSAPPNPTARRDRDRDENTHRPTDAPKGFKTVGSTGGFRRHFGAAPAAKSGPGSLGPASVSFSGGKKRPFSSSTPVSGSTAGPAARKGGSARAALGFEDYDDRPPSPPAAASTAAPIPGPVKPIPKVFSTSDDEDDTAAAAARACNEPLVSRPTLRLAQLPPHTSPVFVKSLIPSSLSVEHVQILPSGPAGSPNTERKSVVAIVTLSQDSPAADIEVVVSQLQNKYLGFGYYLSLHRHLSMSSMSCLVTGAAAELHVSGATSLLSAGVSTQPFGAKQMGKDSKSQVPPHYRGGQHNFAPPPSTYGSAASSAAAAAAGINRQSLFYVPVKPPADIRVVRTINKVLEKVLVHGPEFEALLMSRPDVQRDERWAWIWDARSDGGVWYRWRLWEIATGYSTLGKQRSNRDKFVPLFDGGHAWKVPRTNALPFEYTTQLDEFVSDPEYASDSDSDYGEEAAAGGRGDRDKEQTFLNPLEKARLTYLLAGLPTSTARLRKGQVARITAFAMTHASRGAAEVVDMIVANVRRPYSLTGTARKYHALQTERGPANDMEDERREEDRDKDKEKEKEKDKDVDISGACLVGLYIVSDILSAASSSSVRHAWRFRQLFETALKEGGVFGALGGMAECNAWGRLRADRWKRSVDAVLALWEGWCVFPADTQEGFAAAFARATVDARGREKREEEEREREREREQREKEGRWKSMEALPVSTQVAADVQAMDVDGAGAGAGQAVGEGEDVVGEPILDSGDDDEGGTDVEGEPFSESEDDVGVGEPMEEDDKGEDVVGDPIHSDSD